MNNNISTQQYIGYALASVLAVISIYFLIFRQDIGIFGIFFVAATVCVSAVGFPTSKK